MELEAPMFNSLNKPQKRALILRDQLRYIEPHHLDTFIEGITDDEPPTYRKTNGVIHPPLTFVALKDAATRFDLGNVLFPEEKNAVHRVYLTVEDGHFEMRTEEALPTNDANLDSVPIHGFIAGTMVPMFKNKVQAIFARQDKINAARRAAYNTPHQPPTQFQEGQTLARLDPTKAEQNADVSYSRKARKRRPGDPVAKHSSNKRKRTGLDDIPDDMKSATFNTIPDQIKVDLFNTIIKTAFPNFDNLMMASWNVISIYSAVGTDFPELHRAIVDLKYVLQEFDEAFGMRADRTEPRYRHDLDAASRNGSNGHRLLAPPPTPDATENDDGFAGQTRRASNGVAEQRDDGDAAADDTEEHSAEAQHNMPPPRILQLTPQPEDDDEDAQVPRPSPRRIPEIQSGASHPRPSSTSSPPHTPARRSSQPFQPSGSVASSAHSSPAPPPQPPREQARKARDRNGDAAAAAAAAATDDADRTPVLATSPELARRREAYASSISKTNKHASASAAAAARLDDADAPSDRDQPHDPHAAPPPKKKRPIADYTTAQLWQKYTDHKDLLVRTHGSLVSVPPKDAAQLQQLETAVRAREQGDKDKDREKERPSERRPPVPGVGMAGSYLGHSLGHSLLGAKKAVGAAPVAPMLHTRKEGGSGSGNGKDGSVRRGH